MKFINKFGISVVAIFVAMFLVLGVAWPAAADSQNNNGNNNGNGHDPVTVCHKPGTPAEKELTFDDDGWEAHINHGDSEGPCPVVQPTTTTTEVEPTTTTESEQPTTTVVEEEETTTTTEQETTTTTEQLPVVVLNGPPPCSAEYTFGPSRRFVSGGSQSLGTIPAGIYDVTVVTYDGYLPGQFESAPQGRVGTNPVDQKNEIVSVLGITTEDLDDNVMEASAVKTERVTLIEETDVLVVHQNVSYDSVLVPIICAEPIIPVTPQPEISIVCVDEGISSYNVTGEGNLVVTVNGVEAKTSGEIKAGDVVVAYSSIDGRDSKKTTATAEDCPEINPEPPVIEVECSDEDVVSYNVFAANSEGDISVFVDGVEAKSSGEVASGSVITAYIVSEGNFGPVQSATVTVTAEDCDEIVPADPVISFECSAENEVSYTTDATRVRFYDADGVQVDVYTDSTEVIPEDAVSYRLILITKGTYGNVRTVVNGDIPELDCSEVVAVAPVIDTECLATDLVAYTVTGENVTVTVNGEAAELTGEVAPGNIIVATSTVDGIFSEAITETTTLVVEDCPEIQTPPPVITQVCGISGTFVTVTFPGNPTFTNIVTTSGRPDLTTVEPGVFTFTANPGDSILATSTFDPNFGDRFDVSATATAEDCSYPTQGVITFECAADGLFVMTVTVDFDNDFNTLYVEGVIQTLNTETGASYLVQPGDAVLLTSVRNGEEISTLGTAPSAEDCEELGEPPVVVVEDSLPVTGSNTGTLVAVSAFLVLAGSAMVLGSRRRLA